jgi:hypothetical protein
MFGHRYRRVWARAPMGPDRLFPRGSHAPQEQATAEPGEEVVELAEEVAEPAEVAGAGAPVAFSKGAEADQ